MHRALSNKGKTESLASPLVMDIAHHDIIVRLWHRTTLKPSIWLARL
jgi:hypothetical protein